MIILYPEVERHSKQKARATNTPGKRLLFGEGFPHNVAPELFSPERFIDLFALLDLAEVIGDGTIITCRVLKDLLG